MFVGSRGIKNGNGREDAQDSSVAVISTSLSLYRFHSCVMSGGPPKKNAARDALASSSASELIVSFLLREGYTDTVASMLENGERLASTTAARSRIGHLRKAENSRKLVAKAVGRMKVRDLVRSGDIEAALNACECLLLKPLELENISPSIFFDLLCQKFVELVRNRDINQACQFSQEELAPRSSKDKHSFSRMADLCALLAYKEPEKSSVSYLLDVRRRWSLADRLSGILFTMQFEGFACGTQQLSALEVVVRHAKLVDLLKQRFQNEADGTEDDDRRKNSGNRLSQPEVDDDDDDEDNESSDARGTAPPRTLVEDAEVVEVEMNDD